MASAHDRSRAIAAAEEALGLIVGHPRAHFVGERSEELIVKAEKALGLLFPESYRTFVRRLGAGGFGAFEIYGVTDEPFDGPIPDGVWATLDSRSGPSNLPATMIVFGADGMGGEYVLDTAKGPEPPVEVWIGGMSAVGEPLEVLASDFGSFLREQVLEQMGHL